MLEILEKQDSWYKVRLPLGEVGWVREDLVTLEAVQPALAHSARLPHESGAIDEGQLGQGDEAADANSPEMTPLLLSASASTAREESQNTSPTLTGPQGPEKPKFLMLFVAVIAGLSAFAVLLFVGAVASRRRSEGAPAATASTDSHKPGKDMKYSDPLLSWVRGTPTDPAPSGDDVEQQNSASTPDSGLETGVTDGDQLAPVKDEDATNEAKTEDTQEEVQPERAETSTPSSSTIEGSALFKEIEEEMKSEAKERASEGPEETAEDDFEQRTLIATPETEEPLSGMETTDDEPVPEIETGLEAAPEVGTLEVEAQAEEAELAAKTLAEFASLERAAPVLLIAKREEESKGETSKSSRSRSRNRRRARKRRRRRR
jgi:hypothetical protein